MKKILFLVNHFFTIYYFRKELIHKLLTSHYEVYISMPPSEQNIIFADMGCKVIETSMDRRNINPIQDIKLVLKYNKIIKSVNPDIIFSYTVKPNVYGSMASNQLHYKQICNITGTGAIFLKESYLSKLIRTLYRISVKKTYKVFFQNTDDMDYFILHRLVNENIELLPGSGVNLGQHSFSEMPGDDIVNFIYIGRIMNIKGIEQYLDCAKYIKTKHSNTCFYIAGFIEEKRYQSIIEQYHNARWINYIGFQKSIDEWIEKCHCTVLPSLGGEGVPNVLLESASKGRVCIASIVNGSKDVVEDGITGYLFEAGNSEDLIEKAQKFLALSFEEKRKMGIASRKKVEKEFDRQIVIDAYLNEINKL